MSLKVNKPHIHSAGSQTQHEKDYSINRECILTELPSISISRSFPHNWMHLCLENHGKNLISFWKGMYKGMDEGQEEYWILDHVWAVIGKEMATASNTIPAAFGWRTPNIYTKAHVFTAEDWSFWLIHLTPLVLKGHFWCPKYYKHFMKFNTILKRTLQYSFTEQELVNLENNIISYVQEYEK